MTKTEYREGDLIRVINNETGEGFQARARKCPENYYQDTLFLDREWSQHWKQWTFLEWWTREDSGYTVDLVERAPEPVKREKGWYKEDDATLWYWDGENWRDNGTEDAFTYSAEPTMIGGLERLYTKAEVMAKVRTEAWRTDPNYVFGSNDLLSMIDELEAHL